jgi:3-dehydroquinate synthetase
MSRLVPNASKVVLVTDDRVLSLHGYRICNQLNIASWITVPEGEACKSLATFANVVDLLSHLELDRASCLIALGGGSITDLVGFTASVYLRSLPLILVPTTLLAMIDAAIGGKTAINLPQGKNLIGTYVTPLATFIDPSFLITLPSQEIYCGLAEIVKLALVTAPELLPLRPLELGYLRSAIEAKVAVVQQDPYDLGYRHILNFGHTIGHALEALSNYTLPHGLAVTIGILGASHLSMELGFLAQDEFSSICRVLDPFPLDICLNYTPTQIWQALQTDKKRQNSHVCFVLIDRIGHPLAFGGNYTRPIYLEELLPTLHWLRQRFS